jgi:hypothetical protein
LGKRTKRPRKNVSRAFPNKTAYDTDSELKIWGIDNRDVFHGAPVCFQIVGPRLQEEQTLMVTEVVCRTLHGN